MMMCICLIIRRRVTARRNKAIALCIFLSLTGRSTMLSCAGNVFKTAAELREEQLAARAARTGDDASDQIVAEVRPVGKGCREQATQQRQKGPRS